MGAAIFSALSQSYSSWTLMSLYCVYSTRVLERVIGSRRYSGVLLLSATSAWAVVSITGRRASFLPSLLSSLLSLYFILIPSTTPLVKGIGDSSLAAVATFYYSYMVGFYSIVSIATALGIASYPSILLQWVSLPSSVSRWMHSVLGVKSEILSPNAFDSATPRAAANETTNVTIEPSIESINLLVGMGFPREAVIRALKAKDWDVEGAIALLV